jgi:prophage regulatory protein
MFNNAQRGANMTHTILRLPAVLRERARSRSAHYLDIQQGLFTSPVQIGLRAVGWPETEVATLNAARIAGKSEVEIRELVAKLQAARKAAA